MTGSDRVRLMFFALSGLVYIPFSQWISTTSVGTSVFLWGQLLYVAPACISLPAVPVLCVCLLTPRCRQTAVFYLPICLLFIACGIGGSYLGQRTRMTGMRRCVDRSQPLVQAIRAFELDYRAPPRSLSQLVPDYLPGVPSTGMMAYPEYRYHTGEQAELRFDGNHWALTVDTPAGGINFDMLLFLPNGNYPEQGHGGWLERVGDWAYVHE